MTTNRRIPALEYFAWQPPVLSKDTLTPPPNPTKGARYAIDGVGTDAWAGHDGEIAWYDGTEWQFDVPEEGWQLYVNDLSDYFVFS